MVPRSSRTTHRLSKRTSNKGKSAHSKKGSDYASRSRKSPSSSLENIQGQNSQGKFSEKVKTFINNSRRSSTRKVYDARLQVYKSWCNSRKLDPHKASEGDLAEFFVYLHEKRNCKAITIAGYRSAIASVHSGWSNCSVSNNSNLSKVIKGIFNSSPLVRPLLPNWDLPSVLWTLCDHPFEPISSCDLKFLTWKTVFLLALSSASRVSELQALSIGEGHMRIEHNGIRLLPNLQFLAKTQRMQKPWNPIFIPEFNSFATDSRDLLLCPCRALKMYVQRTKDIRHQEMCLFLTYQSGLHRKASKNSISRWIVSLIKHAYEIRGENLTNVRAHDTRRLSTSWALFNGASVSDILQAAHWSTESTFTSFYMRDVPQGEARFARTSVLDTVRWARENRK